MTSSGALRLILVRHGQTPCNVTDRWHGWEDCNLNEVGQAQAEATGERLADVPVDALYSSDLRRTRQTAEAIGRRHALEPILLPDLRERHAGDFEGLLAHEVLAADPGWERARSADYWGWAPPGGETFKQVLERTLRAIEHIRREHPDGTVVAVTHMGPLRVLTSHLTGMSIAETYRREFPSTGLTVLCLCGDDVKIEKLNDASHTARV